jgi:hypothetical protein
VGGPAAIGEIGDFVLENDKIRTVILQEGNSVGPGMFGGTLVDADLRRPELRHSAGRGLDQFAELFPMVNMVVPGYDDGAASEVGDLSVTVWSSQDDDNCPLTEEEAPQGCAAIRVAGKADRLVEVLGAMFFLGMEINISFVHYYALRPGDSHVTVRTFFWTDRTWDPSDADLELGAPDEPSRLLELAVHPEVGQLHHPITEPVPVFDALLGNTSSWSSDSGVPYRRPGLLAGDFLLLGKQLEPFGTSTVAAGAAANRSGFEMGYLFQKMYDRGEILLQRPLANTVMVGVGHDVSYGYFSAAGQVEIPIFTGAFTGAFTHIMQCETEGPGEPCPRPPRAPLVFDRYFAVGRGDAASVLDSYYAITGTPTGRLRGHVLDEQSGEPLSGAQVFVVLDPRQDDSDSDVTTYATVAAALRARDGDGDGVADNDPGIVSQTVTDVGLDRVPDGSFSLSLEPGQYLVVPFVHGRLPGRPVAVTIKAGRERQLSLALPPAGRLQFEIHDNQGELQPGKLTLIGPLAEGTGCPSSLDIPELSLLRHLELGSAERPQGIAQVAYSASGQGSLELAPGRYEAIASRGFEHSIDRRCLEVRHDTSPIEHFSVLREVETTGWVAGDFHVHGTNSFDGTLTHEQRVVTAAVEGIEVFAATDHDYITEVTPAIFDGAMRHQVSAMVGLEVSPIELGHFLGFPLRFDETAQDNLALDWTRRDRCLEEPSRFGCPEHETGYMALTPDEVFEALRDLGAYGREHTVVAVPHPRDGYFGYFSQYNLHPFSLSFEAAGLRTGNPLLEPFLPPSAPDGAEPVSLYSERFDAVEVFNGTRYELIRTPTIREVTDFVQDMRAAADQGLPEDGYLRLMAEVHQRSVRRVLVRTAEEQQRLRYGSAPDCLRSSDCDAGELCDPDLSTCVADPGVDCTDHGDCPVGAVCKEAEEVQRCLPACSSDRDCPVSHYCALLDRADYGTCEAGDCNLDATGALLPGAPEDGDRPCVINGLAHAEGGVDDWFRLLNYGLPYTAMGNSDTHSYALEIGLPRNFVMASTDAPAAIDHREIADNILAHRVVASYGPFIELWAEGGAIGDQVKAEGPVELRLRVQSASWFDVDRIEVYANGELLCDVGVASTEASRCATTATMAVGPDGHNTDVVNFEGTIVDEPGRDTWYAVVAMGASERARGLSPVYFASLHPQLGFSEVIGQAFAVVPLLASLVPAPIDRAQVNSLVPYAVTNPIWVDVDGDGQWTAPLGVGAEAGVPPYRRQLPCQFARDPRGCRQDVLVGD